VDAFLNRVAEVGTQAALDELPSEVQTRMELIDVDATMYVEKGAIVQLALAWDPKTGDVIELGRGTARAHRDYSKVPFGSICGTLDVLTVAGDAVHVRDCKVTTKDLGPPSSALQLLFGAVAAAKLFGKTASTVGWLKVGEGRVTQQVESLDEFDIDAAGERMRRVVADVQKKTPKMNEGPHCAYCPGFALCPAKTALFADYQTEELDADVEAWSDDQLGKAWDRSGLVIEVAERVRSIVRERVARGELSLPRGRVLRMVEAERRSLDVAGVRKLLPEAVEVKESASQASIRRAPSS